MEDANRQIFTLSDLGKSLRSVIERNYSSTYWIKAEIAKLNFYPRSGHCYPELVHKTGNVINAQMRSTIWAADFKTINKQFLEVTGEQLKEGISILFRASVTYHPVYGLSLQIWEVEPSFTLGEMAVEKAKAIARLKEEGIFDRNKSLPIALLTKRIAVISVETSKGYHDFLNIINGHPGRYFVWHFLFPSVLQGDKAVEGIISQLRIIKRAISRFDMVAIIRGGGGDIGLSCYDDYSLAREIALFPLPVITGIGHSTNETIAEMVAWANKITPTDVGYFILGKFREFEERFDNALEILESTISWMLENRKQKLISIENKMIEELADNFSSKAKKLDKISASVSMGATKKCNRYMKNLDNLAFAVTIKPGKAIAAQKFRVEKQDILLTKNSEHLLEKGNTLVSDYDDKCRLLDPENVLARGYSLTTMNNVIIKDSSVLKEGDVLHTRFSKGSAESTVGKTK
jgi:exodeoxyribonuclease VII large subunit